MYSRSSNRSITKQQQGKATTIAATAVTRPTKRTIQHVLSAYVPVHAPRALQKWFRSCQRTPSMAGYKMCYHGWTLLATTEISITKLVNSGFRSIMFILIFLLFIFLSLAIPWASNRDSLPLCWIITNRNYTLHKRNRSFLKILLS